MKITTLFTLVLIATTNGNVQGGGQGGGILPGGAPPEIPSGVPGGIACNACGMMALQQGCQRACSIPMCSGLLCMQLCPKVVNACKGSIPGKQL